MNGYIIVLPEGVLSSEQRAERISRELYCVTAPLATQEPYQHDGKVFGMVEHPDGVQFALQVDTEYNIPVSPLATLERLISLMTELTEIRGTCSCLPTFSTRNRSRLGQSFQVRRR